MSSGNIARNMYKLIWDRIATVSRLRVKKCENLLVASDLLWNVTRILESFYIPLSKFNK